MSPLAEAYVRSGKVRDLYRLDDGRLLLVASDRISAFDVVLPTTIADKGRVLTGLSRYWFSHTAGIVPNHLRSTDPADAEAAVDATEAELRGRIMICRTTEVIPIEAVVRGYLAGSGWKEYRASGRVCGIPLPAGLRESDRLPEPIFTPATKAEGGHDENVSFEAMASAVGVDLAADLRKNSLTVYRLAMAHAAARGIILADTKFEWGTLPDGAVLLIDEVLTPDSSRFWPADQYKVDTSPPSFDKQFVRDWLETTGWDKQSPPPPLPPDVVEKTAAKYWEAFDRLTH
jgi:phosphoribosylaminoimidazole-succinocarboxamide synthase